MGFIPDIERICKLVPFTRQTLFFTATMPNEIQRITEQFLHNPVRVEVSRPATTASAITQQLIKSGRDAADKRDILRKLIRSAEGLKNGIVFCNRKSEVATVYRSLKRHGFSVQELHGDMSQPERTAALEAFRKNEVTLLVASDVAARGLDIPDVSHIYIFDVPHHPDDYVHRIGRTGRAGRSGVAITIVSPADVKSIGAVEKLIGQSIPWIEGADTPETQSDANADTSAASHEQRSRPGRQRNGGSRSRNSAAPVRMKLSLWRSSSANCRASIKPALNRGRTGGRAPMRRPEFPSTSTASPQNKPEFGCAASAARPVAKKPGMTKSSAAPK
jgi:superfamily II DNA/RNA helicase